MEQTSERLFLALWPEPAWQQQAHRLACSLVRNTGGRAILPGNIHLTVAFLGSVEGAQRNAVITTLERLDCPVFDFTLDQLGWWKRSRVVWLAPSSLPEPLDELYGCVNRRLPSCGLRAEQRPFRPHLSLIRKALRPPAVATAPLPALWRVKELTLVRSTTYSSGPQYAIIHRRKLLPLEPVRGERD